jgi:uncharacterized protein (TIGR02599 family)
MMQTSTHFRVMRPPFIHSPHAKNKGFSLVEILVSLAVLAILLLINVQVIDQVQSTWAASNARVSQFREARTAFDILVRNLSQATLNTFVDYDSNYVINAAQNAGATLQTPTSYLRKSNLQFVCGPSTSLLSGGGGAALMPGHAVFFQAPLGVSENPSFVGLDRLLCSRGYFVQFTSDEPFKPPFITSSGTKYRYRLMEFSPPAEKNLVYNSMNTTGVATNSWFSAAAGLANAINASENALNVGITRPIADNILALIISPRQDTQANQTGTATIIAPSYSYNSTLVTLATANSPQGTQNLLPPLVKIVLVAIDERSAERLAEQNASAPPFGTSLTSPFNNANQLESTEIPNLIAYLASQKVNYRLFSATVQIRSSKGGL